jgi:hypothetical protein
MKKVIYPLLLLAIWLILPGFAKKNMTGIDPDLLHFFTGRWVGEGQFAGGAKISADVSFALSLDSCWLVYEHRDRLPNNYKATSFWGVDGQTGQFVAYTLDNFHGHREWMSNGWKGGRLVLSTHGFDVRMGSYYEHFIYEKLSDNSFKMTYELSGDGILWQLGDYLIFTRQQG